MSLVVRTGMDANTIASAVRNELRALDPDLPAPPVRTMAAIVSESTADRRYQMSLVLLFGGTALLLASIGIFGVVSYSVAQRRGEMGIRMALGAGAGELHGMVLRQGMLPVWIGLAAGLVAAFALGRLLSSLLFGVSATDPRVFGTVAVLLAAVSLLACYVPARRATQVDPIRALRYE
jgi:putative ABC transport system permease protein